MDITNPDYKVVAEQPTVTFRYITDLNLGTLNRRRKPNEPPLDSGIIVLAIQKLEEGDFRVGVAVCNPRDIIENRYSKKLGRTIAENRMRSEKSATFAAPDGKFNRTDLKLAALACADNTGLLPKHRPWVQNLLNRFCFVQ